MTCAVPYSRAQALASRPFARLTTLPFATSARASLSSPVAFDFHATMIPHPEKAARGGEDAYFAQPFAIGVADGVGGWAMSGVDPSHFSRALTRGAEKLAITG